MGRMPSRMRLIAWSLTLALVAGTVGVLTAAAPASAGTSFQEPPRVSWVYTDSREKDASIAPTSDVPVGSWRDAQGKHHKSRTFVTFDISGLGGKRIVSAELFLRDVATTNCDLRALEIWETTDPASPPTWRDSPTQASLAATIGPSICPGSIGRDLSATVRAAVEDGRTLLSLVIRVPDAVEGDVRHGRVLSRSTGIHLSVGYNSLPGVVDEHLYNNLRPCDTDAPYNFLAVRFPGPTLSAMFLDADQSDIVAGEFAFWPVDDPAQRTVLTRSFAGSGSVVSVTADVNAFDDGRTYAWAARAHDGTDSSPWSRTCFFTADKTPPATAPSVTSPHYLPDQFNQGGIPATFTFTPNGVDDVAAYQYTFSDPFGVPVVPIGPNGIPQWSDPFDRPGFVRPGPDGSATVTLELPSSFVVRLQVRSWDRAYNAGPGTAYRFFVTDTSPTVSRDSGRVRAGQPFTMQFAPHPDLADVIEYSYRINSAEPQTVAAGPDGTATATLTLTELGFYDIGYGAAAPTGGSHRREAFSSSSPTGQP